MERQIASSVQPGCKEGDQPVWDRRDNGHTTRELPGLHGGKREDTSQEQSIHGRPAGQ